MTGRLKLIVLQFIGIDSVAILKAGNVYSNYTSKALTEDGAFMEKCIV